MAANLTVHSPPGQPITVVVGGIKVTGILGLEARAQPDGHVCLHLTVAMDGVHSEWLHTAPPVEPAKEFFQGGPYGDPETPPESTTLPHMPRYPFGDSTVLLASVAAGKHEGRLSFPSPPMEDNPGDPGPAAHEDPSP